jgi:hypothetical protein
MPAMKSTFEIVMLRPVILRDYRAAQPSIAQALDQDPHNAKRPAYP